MTTDFSDVLQRIQEKIPVEEITPDVVAQFLAGHDNRGKTQERRILGTLISDTIQTEQKIARSFALVEDFARSKRVKLTEKTYGNVYENWGRYHRPATVLFRNGKIFKWRYL